MYDVEDENRFWSKILTGEIDECWEIVGLCLDKDGYASLCANGKIIKAHRFSFQLFHNRLIEDKMLICHKCDNPSCVNPYHLFEGTMKDNMTDMINKGRGNKKGVVGEAHCSSKLTEKQVKEIRAKYAAGGTTEIKLGFEYGVSSTLIGQVVRRKIWKHVE